MSAGKTADELIFPNINLKFKEKKKATAPPMRME